ncbi:MAG TPA: NAD(P)/FAD-dependent oxidoreductase [Nitrospinota bacterium]|jgi:phytoene dehydrogenase-like protein|nr:NAD(P)/FAD-dependent oxidoreductase [Nitrospinota bacterium]MDP7369473.1 NAD(P)/FAD-dependent oxidoreductase [Nitrospinota bacterium]MDP7504559.1 NAD(P)/FAD-dependent oxidoreductase [Nitrospinota bacterium]MDP7662478.1 NAD(P)/FAD-dependent oxidoreductase [Nitrospinota bacterium]HJP13963.1 NAD(P)/FAD-dependent oxidoreductase [Nitrospinota bacterium]
MGNYDGIMIGAGHNALVCAAYMARSSLKVGIFESEEEIGGGSSTLEYLLPGYRSNMHANFFIGLDDFPIMSDLDLGRYGFRWLTPPVQHAALFRDGSAIVLHRDPEKSAASIARFSEKDAKTFRELHQRYAVELGPLMRSFLFHTPLPPAEIAERVQGEKGRDLLAFAPMSISGAIDAHFEHPRLRTLFKLFAHAITVEDEPGTGMFFPGLFSTQTTLGLPCGGALELPRALEKLVVEQGGEVHRSSRVREVIREGGRAAGGVLDDGSRHLANKFVASGLNAPASIRLAGEDAFPGEVNEKIRTWDWGFHSLMTLHIATSERPVYRAEEYDPAVGESFNIIFGADTDEEVEQNAQERRAGKIPTRPMGNGSCNSQHDPSYTPDGGHVAFWWPGAPYSIEGKGPEKWDEIQEEMTGRLLDVWREYAPNLTGDTLRAAKLFTPLDIERGNSNMVNVAVRMGAYKKDQLGVNRPHPLLSGLRTPLEGFYLCGSSCQGGGLNGAPGYNAAGVIADDLNLEKWWTPLPAPELSEAVH